MLASSWGNLAAIYELRNNWWSPALIQVSNGAPSGTDFALLPGQGYLLYSDRAGSYRESCGVPAILPTWTLTSGWNLVGISMGGTGPISASTVLAGVQQRSGGNSAAIYALSNNQWSPSLILAGAGAPSGTDFVLQPGQGYLLCTRTRAQTIRRPRARPSQARIRVGAKLSVLPRRPSARHRGW